jgi:uncharacterized protein
VFEFRVISLDTDRRRIGLSRKTERPAEQAHGKADPVKKTEAAGGERREAGSGGGRGRADGRKPVVKKAESAPQPYQPRPRSDPNDDGTMYNPFAELLKSRQEKKPKGKR